jgi:hypothetical protein
MELERLDRLFAAVWPLAIAGDLAAVDRVLKIMARRAKMEGFDKETVKLIGDKDNPLRMEHSGEGKLEILDVKSDEFKQLPVEERLRRLQEAITAMN